MLDPETATRERVCDRDVRGSVVCEQPFNRDSVAAVEGDGTAKEADRCRRFLVAEDLGVGEATVVVDRDVDVLPAFLALIAPVVAAAGDSVTGPVDPTQLLDVDVEELAGACALVAPRLLEAESPQPTQPRPGQDPGDRRQRHRERFRDLSGREAQLPQRDDRRDPLLGGAVGDSPWRRGTITQSSFPFEPVATDPLARAADADAHGSCSRCHRPSLINNQRAEPTTTAPAESSVSVQIHPATSLGPSLPLTALSLQGGPDEPTSSGTTASALDSNRGRAALVKLASGVVSLSVDARLDQPDVIVASSA